MTFVVSNDWLTSADDSRSLATQRTSTCRQLTTWNYDNVRQYNNRAQFEATKAINVIQLNPVLHLSTMDTIGPRFAHRSPTDSSMDHFRTPCWVFVATLMLEMPTLPANPLIAQSRQTSLSTKIVEVYVLYLVRGSNSAQPDWGHFRLSMYHKRHSNRHNMKRGIGVATSRSSSEVI